jgi:beta-lactamase class D
MQCVDNGLTSLKLVISRKFHVLKTFLSILALTFLMASCSQNNVTEDDSLKQYFDAAGVSGSFGMFDNGQGHFTIYNLSRFRDSAYLPAGTFDIVQALVGIQTGVLKDEHTLIGTANPEQDSTYADLLSKVSHLPTDSEHCLFSWMEIKEAFRCACPRPFQELARRIGKDSLKRWVDSMRYGNKSMGNAIDTFWLDNHLTITSDEQLGLVKRLYFDQLPFYPRPQKIVRQMMLMESNSNYQLSYKTGEGIRKDGHAFTWVVGWVEENKHAYFFVLNADAAGSGNDLKVKGLEVLKNILKQLGFFQGKK